MTEQFPTVDAVVPEITAATLKARLDAGEHVIVLDTRRPADYETWHIDGDTVTAINVPFTAFMDGDDPADRAPASFVDALPESYDAPIVTCCAKGISSLYVAEFLATEGYDVVALEDGMRGWAGLYESRALPAEYTPEGVEVVQFHRPSSGCLAYLVVSDGEAMVVDPLRAFANEYAAAADERDAALVSAVDTHVHADHVSGVATVAAGTDATALVPAGAEGRGYEGDADHVHAGDELAVGDATVEAVALPGHTSEMLGYRVGDVLIAGDTIFTDSVARPDLEEGDDGARAAASQLYDTIQELGELDDDAAPRAANRSSGPRPRDDVLVAPGHTSENAKPRADGTYAATLAELRERLPAFERDREAFVDAILDGMPPRPNNYERIIAANLGREDVSDSEAFELELGPNNCAAGE